jgi:hypothetical protein
VVEKEPLQKVNDYTKNISQLIFSPGLSQPTDLTGQFSKKKYPNASNLKGDLSKSFDGSKQQAYIKNL